MIFPFTLTLRKKLTGEIDNYTSKEIVIHVSHLFKESSANYVEITDNHVIAENKLFTFKIRRGGNTNRWGGISKAKFEITEYGNIRKAFYTINLTRVLVVGLVLGIVGFFLGDYWIGLFAFLFFGGLNWLVKIIQHISIFHDIINNIETIEEK